MTNPRGLVEVSHLSHIYRSKRKVIQALTDVSLRCSASEVVGLIGANGAGKTTFIKCLSGLLVASAGTICVLGRDVRATRGRGIAGISVLLAGTRQLYWRLTVNENLRYFASLRGLSSAEATTQAGFLLGALALERYAETEVRKLSTGIQQRAAIAAVMMSMPRILLLDEPTAALDVETSVEVQRIVRDWASRYEALVIFSSHDLRAVENVCDRVLMVRDGTLVIDEPIELLLNTIAQRVVRVVIRQERDFLLPEGHGVTVVRRTDGTREISVPMDDPMLVYHVMQILEVAGAVVEEISTERPDLEALYFSRSRPSIVRATAQGGLQ